MPVFSLAFLLIKAFKAKLQICLAYSCTTYQQMFDGLSGSSLNTMKITTLSLTSKHSVANSTHFFQSQNQQMSEGLPEHYEDGLHRYQLSAVHPYDIQVFIAKSLCQTMCTPFFAMVVTDFTVLHCQESGYVSPRRSSLCPIDALVLQCCLGSPLTTWFSTVALIATSLSTDLQIKDSISRPKYWSCWVKNTN
ncbi:hypothetical protein Bpfe_005384 [Biomphalaria pfeifferi]|uniref:Uncharacterized protein n=1 Tax=Biomphalaria pfeifferi TaxID=112525 RepID=A0AAD8FIP1_BIOPF|nr:hypothetical protein Bpfe_005384 [Biomphalaria pfeifferi]